MASPSDRDNKPNKIQTTTDNPFIKFRQFADSQISSFIQRIIGFPNQIDHPRWAEFDEDLRRRDELQARNRELKETEARRLEQAEHDEEQHSVVRRRAVVEDEDECGLRDVPLYSAVSHSHFSHLSGFPKDGEKPWTKIFKHDKGYSPPEEDLHPGVLRCTQYILYDHLATSLANRSDYSLLPYLLFSPYSPLKLATSMVTQPSHENGVPTLVRDEFPYRQAFQDLIQTSYPQPLSPRMIWFWNIFGVNYLERSPNVITEATQNKAWIDNLYLSNILQRKQVHKLNAGDYRLYEETERDDFSDYETEQDMYDDFLQWATRPHTVGSILDILDDPFKHLKENQANSGEAGMWTEKTWERKHAKALREVAGHWEKLQSSTSTESSSSNLPSDASSSSALSPDKVVSSSTTTEQTVDENGCVETCVTVWKRFANGRETTTTTTHVEEPAAGEEEKTRRRANPVVDQSEPGNVSDKKIEKRGWFWN